MLSALKTTAGRIFLQSELMKEVPIKRGKIKIEPNIIDKVVNFFDPVRGARRLRARAMMAFAGGYIGASKSRRKLKMWTAYGHDDDSNPV